MRPLSTRSVPSIPNIPAHIRSWIGLLALCMPGLPACAEEANATAAEKTPEKNGAIVSDREKVALVENSNVAEAVSRRPDLQFQNVTIDGEKATIDLSSIPANSVLSAEVSKAATPDLDADTQGSGLNLRSKPVYDLENRVIEGSIGTRYRPLLDAFQNEISFTYGHPLKNSGFMFTVGAEDGSEGSEGYGQDWGLETVDGREEYVLADQSLKFNDRQEQEFNANMIYDFRINGHIRLYFKADGEYEERESIHPRFTLRYEDGETVSVNDEEVVVEEATARRVMQGGSFEGKEYTLSTGAYFDYDTYALDYFVSYLNSVVLEPDWIRSDFLTDPMDVRYDWTDRSTPQFQPLEGEPDLYDPQNFTFDEHRITRWEDGSDEWIGRLNLRIPFEIGSWSAAVKGGAKVRYRDSYIDADANVYTGYNGLLTIDDVLGSYRNDDLLDGNYVHGPFPGIAETRRFFSNNVSNYIYDETRSREISDPNSWDVNQQISAAYLMGYLKTGKLRAIAGLRAEQTDMTYDAYQLETDTDGNYLRTLPVSDESSYTNYFPGIHGRYDLSDKLSFISSWTYTIQRPHYGNLVPKRNINHEEQYISQGNPGLKPTRFTNFNAAIDYSPQTGSMVSLELFMLELKDTVFFEVTGVTSGPFSGFDIGSSQNGPSAEAMGARLIWNQDLGNWWARASGFHFSTKYTWQDTETEYPARPGETHPMTGYPEHQFELLLTYEMDRLFAQLSFEYQSESLSWLQEETWRDRYRDTDYDLDFSLSYQLSENLRLLVDVYNVIEHREGRSYRGHPSRPADYSWSSRQYGLSVKYKI